MLCMARELKPRHMSRYEKIAPKVDELLVQKSLAVISLGGVGHLLGSSMFGYTDACQVMGPALWHIGLVETHKKRFYRRLHLTSELPTFTPSREEKKYI